MLSPSYFYYLLTEHRLHLCGATYLNPILNVDFPDPTVMRDTDGSFYVYGTCHTYSNGTLVRIQVAQSTDLVNWSYLGEALPNAPRVFCLFLLTLYLFIIIINLFQKWAQKTESFWAPGIGTYIAYY